MRRITIRYDVSQYDGNEVLAKTLTVEEKRKLKPKQFDCFMSLSDGVLGFRAKDRKWREYHGRWPRIGPVSLKILQAVMLNPGDFLSPVQILDLTGYESLLDGGVLAARIHGLRKTFLDTTEYFIQTRKSAGYALRWSKSRTWLWVERIVDPPEPQD